MVNNEATVKQIKFLLNKQFPNNKRKLQEQRQSLLKCMELGGYIEYLVEEITEEPDYGQFPESGSDSDSDSDSEFFNDSQDFLPSIMEQSQSSVSRYNRTFIQPTQDNVNQRLYAVQNYTITPEEQDFNNIKEHLSSVINKLELKDDPGILNNAMDMYKNIVDFYKISNEIKGEIKGSVKRGYLLLILYYTLIKFRICITKADLVVYFTGSSIKVDLSDLAKADKNIKFMFGEFNDNEICLIFMRNLFNYNQIKQIEDKLEELKDSMKINNPATAPQIASVIKFVTKMDFKTIKQYCGINIDTLRKNYKKIF